MLLQPVDQFTSLQQPQSHSAAGQWSGRADRVADRDQPGQRRPARIVELPAVGVVQPAAGQHRGNRPRPYRVDPVRQLRDGAHRFGEDVVEPQVP
jgi:hypothetical protein